MCYYDCHDLDVAKVEREEMRKAAKAHRCSECRNGIPKGDKYQNYTGLWDGCWTTYKTCMACMDLRKRIYGDGCCYMFGALAEDAYEYLRDMANLKRTGRAVDLETVALAEKLLGEPYVDWTSEDDRPVRWSA